MAVLEALACGTPAIVSQGCNIPEIEKFRAGLVVPATVSHFSKAMLDVLLDNDKRTSMKGNARRLIESKFTARAMAIAMKRVYEESIVEHGHPRGSTSRR